VYEQIQKELPKKDPRFRIEHCTLLTDTLIRRMRALQVIPAPFSGYVYFHGDVLHFYGQERTQNMFPCAVSSTPDCVRRIPPITQPVLQIL